MEFDEQDLCVNELREVETMLQELTFSLSGLDLGTLRSAIDRIVNVRETLDK